MNTYRPGDKDISKLFSSLRAQLQAKEKELLELQRTNPSLLPPDSEQINALISAIRSLQLSTQDGSFVFASDCDFEEVSSFSRSSVHSTGFESIKSLPSSVWLSPTNSTKQQKRQQPSIFNHLFELPAKTYLASSWPSTFQPSMQSQTKTDQHASIASHLLFMPLNAFKAPPITTFVPVEIKHTQNPSSNGSPISPRTRESLLTPEMMFSKDIWMQNKKPTSPKPTEGLLSTESMFSKDYWVQNKKPTSPKPTESLLSTQSMFSKDLWVQNQKPTSPKPTESLLSTQSMFSKDLWVQNQNPTSPKPTESLLSTQSMFSKDLWVQNQKPASPNPTSPKPTESLLSTQSMFSKDHWVQNQSPASPKPTESLLSTESMFSKDLWLQDKKSTSALLYLKQ